MSGVEPQYVARFKALFSGFERVHGRYQVTGRAENGKVKGIAETVEGPPTLDHFRRHLSGDERYGLGVVPLRDDNLTVFWGAIDIDDRTINHTALRGSIDRQGLPLVLCRSKSGGAHLFLFLKDPTEAETVRQRLEHWAALLGHGGCEIFPKQSTRTSDQDLGNWLNLPYFGDSRRAVDEKGNDLSLHDFLLLAQERSIDLSSAPIAPPDPGEDGDLLYEAPPCLQLLHARGGFPSGTQNDGMMAVMVYLRKRYGDDWKDHVGRYNEALCSTPRDPEELAALVKSSSKKDYAYRCKQPPISAHCQRRTCLMRRFGVGQTDVGTEIQGLTFYRAGPGDPVHVGFEIAGRRCFMSSDTLFSASSLNKWTFAQLGVVVTTMAQARWMKYLTELAATADEVRLPDDAGESGLVWAHVERFLTQRTLARTVDELRVGKPFREGEWVRFLLVDLVSYLKAQRIEYGSQQKLTKLLRDHGAEHKMMRVAGKQTNVWSIPISEEQPERLELTRPMAEREEF